MDISNLLNNMSVDMNSLTAKEKLIGGLIITALAMAVVFIVLMMILFCINFINKIINKQNEEKIEIKKVKEIKENEHENEEDSDEYELIAVISAAIAAYSNTSTENIIIKNIVRLEDSESNWSIAGRIDNMKRR